MAVPGEFPQNFTVETVIDNTDVIPFLKETGGDFFDSRIALNNFLASGGSLTTRGNWNAATNTPTLVSSVGEKGELYRVSVAGTTSLDGIVAWKPNDFIYFDGSVWRRNFGSNTQVEIFSKAGPGGTEFGNYDVTQLAASSNGFFTFSIPLDFVSLVSAELIGSPTAGAAGASKDIDILSSASALGESSNFHNETDTTTLYDFTGQTGNTIAVLDLSGILTLIDAGDYVGIKVVQNAIGGAINYYGIKFVYLR